MVVDTSAFKPDTPPPAYAPMAPSMPSIPTSSSGTGSAFSPPSSAAPSTSPPYPCMGGQHQHSTPHANVMAGQYDYQSPRAGQRYGPTPLSATQQAALLPYYDPRSPYALAQAVTRARWRFVGAILWAVGIWVGVGLVTGGIVVDIRRSAA